ncbi:MAG TPA: hypothetical protein VN032_02050 [Thermoanaerobaculia bacterium]|nr:hypothetical protein [Thermoanaerobaculia bacterium]
MTPPRPTLEEARTRLRELGYLDAGVERMLFRSVFEGRGGAFLPAVLIGALAAALAAVGSVEASEPGFGASLSAVAALFVSVFVADLAPAGLLALGLGWLADRSSRPGLAATAAGLAAAAGVFALWIAGTYGLAREFSPHSLLWGVPVTVAALVLAAAVRLGFLARAFARSGSLPRGAARRVFAAAAAAGLVTALLLLASRREAPAAQAPHVSPRKRPIVVLAVDGLDLDGPGRPPEAARLLAAGATGWWPAETLSPPQVWTDLATGEAAARHGVRALARVRPLGSPVALRPPFGTSWALRRVGPALGLVANAPVSGADRRRLDFWEVSASAGIPSLSVGWWAAAPWPGATVVENRAVLGRSRNGADADRVAIAIFDDALRTGYGLATVYLPGCDIARDDAAARAGAVATIETLLAQWIARAAQGECALVVLAADSHTRTAGALGRMIVFDAGAAAPIIRIRPEDAAPSILARAGVPAARDLGGGPVAALFAPGSLETATVATYGPRVVPVAASAPESDREYLEKLRSLGYLK